MGFAVDFLEFLEGRVGVDLRGLESCMSQQFLYGFEVCLMVEHRGCEGVPQHVGTPLSLSRHEPELFLHHGPYRVCSQPCSLAGEQECFLVTAIPLVGSPFPYIYINKV